MNLTNFFANCLDFSFDFLLDWLRLWTTAGQVVCLKFACKKINKLRQATELDCISTCGIRVFTLFAVGYSPNKPTVSSVPNRFRKRKVALSYLWLVLHRQKRYTLPSSALNGSFRLSDACVNRETQKASYPHLLRRLSHYPFKFYVC